jgi:hypothetical protein
LDGKPGTSASLPHSTVRTLSPEFCAAIRLLNLEEEIPELKLDPDTWNVSLAVIKVEVSPAGPPKISPKKKKR